MAKKVLSQRRKDRKESDENHNITPYSMPRVPALCVCAVISLAILASLLDRFAAEIALFWQDSYSAAEKRVS